ncbi:MAG: glycosyltransferase family 9 protein [bacterium]|nr:glycosyltransferase family 9 protein [bacterium]
MSTPRRILLKHVGNLGDHLFLAGALLEGVADVWPQAEVTLVTAWGYKDRRGRWGKRNQTGYCIALMKENPHIDHLVHWSDDVCSLDGRVCVEEGVHFPTWDRAHFDHVKTDYDIATELEFGLQAEENPLERIGAAAGLPHVSLGPYPFYGSRRDWDVGALVAERFPRPRVVLLEGLNGMTMRGWDPEKAVALTKRFEDCGVTPIWWGASFTPLFRGRPVTLRENIAFLGQCDLAIGVIGAPMHFAAAAGVQTICLYGAQSMARTAPEFFFSSPTRESRQRHITIFGPTCDEPCLLKRDLPCKNLSDEARVTTGFRHWRAPGRQHDKSCVATIDADIVFATAMDALERRGLWPK